MVDAMESSDANRATTNTYRLVCATFWPNFVVYNNLIFEPQMVIQTETDSEADTQICL